MVVVAIGFVTHSSDSCFSMTVSVPHVIELTGDTHHGHTVLLFPRNNILKGDKGLSDKGPATGVRMTQVAKRTSQCGEWITPTIRDQQAGGAPAFLTQRDVLPAQRSCTPGRTRTGLRRQHQAPGGHGQRGGILLPLAENMETTMSLPFPCPSMRRNMNLTMAFTVHSAETTIKVRLRSRRHLLRRGIPQGLARDKPENTSGLGLWPRAAMGLQLHSGEIPTDPWVLEAVHRMPRLCVSQCGDQSLSTACGDRGEGVPRGGGQRDRELPWPMWFSGRVFGPPT